MNYRKRHDTAKNRISLKKKRKFPTIHMKTFLTHFFRIFPVKPNCMRFGIQIDATLHAKLMLNYMQIGQDSSQLLHAL